MSTIKDVAQAAGVGLGTASRALSGRGAVSAQALARVQQAAQSLNYRPSSIAQALSLQRSGAIGMYVPSVNDAFYANTLENVDRVLRAHRKHLVLVTGVAQLDPREQALDAMEFLQSRDCDGLLVSGYELTPNDLLALRRRIPSVALINRSVPGMMSQSTVLNHHLGGQLAAQAFLSRGHRSIALLRGRETALDNLERIEGFKAELSRHGLTPAFEMSGDFTAEGGYRAGAAFAARVDRGVPLVQRCTAVFCGNDRMAAGLNACLNELGWCLPQDLSLVGYDDDALAPYATPALTTVHVPIGRMAECAAAMVLNMCYDMRLPVQRHFEPHMVWRASLQQGPFDPVIIAPPAVDQPGCAQPRRGPTL